MLYKVLALPENSGIETPPQLPAKRSYLFGKKTLAAIAIIAAVVIAVALFIPRGTAVIPLNVNYVVGEKMIYDTTVTGAYDFGDPGLGFVVPSNTSFSPKQTMEVMDFDGQYYTLNHTTTMGVGNNSYSYSILEKVNKTGYSSYFFSFGNQTTEIPSGMTGSTYLTQLLSKPEVRVGDTLTIPFPSTSLLGSGISGNITMTFKGLEDLTVPAGTYRVFRIDVGTGDQGLSYNIPIGSSNLNFSSSVQMTINYQVYLEYGTMRQIKSTMLETMSLQSTKISYKMNMTMDMVLRQDIKP
jgi:hypothetical protein